MNPLNLIKRYLVLQTVVELGRPGRFVSGNPRRRLQRSPGPEIFGDAGASEAVCTDLGGQARALGPPLNHLQSVGAGQRLAGELVDPPPCASRRKQGAFRIGHETSAVYSIHPSRLAPYDGPE